MTKCITYNNSRNHFVACLQTEGECLWFHRFHICQDLLESKWKPTKLITFTAIFMMIQAIVFWRDSLTGQIIYLYSFRRIYLWNGNMKKYILDWPLPELLYFFSQSVHFSVCTDRSRFKIAQFVKSIEIGKVYSIHVCLLLACTFL